MGTVAKVLEKIKIKKLQNYLRKPGDVNVARIGHVNYVIDNLLDINKQLNKKIDELSNGDSDNFTMYIKYIHDDISPQIFVSGNQLTDINGDPFDIQFKDILGAPAGLHKISLTGAYYQGLELDANKIFVNGTTSINNNEIITNNISAANISGFGNLELTIQTKELEEQLITPKFMSFDLNVTIFKA